MERKISIRIVTPSRDFNLLSDSQIKQIEKLLSDSFKISYSKNCFNLNRTIHDIIEDIEKAMSDSSIDYVMASIGGFSSNSLLEYISWDKWKKPMIGFSDITVLLNAAFKKTNKIQYLGPMLLSFAQPEPLVSHIKKQLKVSLKQKSYVLEKSKLWSDDEWWLNKGKRKYKKSVVTSIKPGSASGYLIGGNLSSFQLLVGTEYMPDVNNSILFIEEDSDETYAKIKRMLDHLKTTKILSSINGIIIGRMPSSYENPVDFFSGYFKDYDIPILYGVDLGHTDPHFTLPIGAKITILKNGTISVKK